MLPPSDTIASPLDIDELEVKIFKALVELESLEQYLYDAGLTKSSKAPALPANVRRYAPPAASEAGGGFPQSLIGGKPSEVPDLGLHEEMEKRRRQELFSFAAASVTEVRSLLHNVVPKR